MRLFMLRSSLLFFFFNDTATTEIYTLSLHDALPILEPPLETEEDVEEEERQKEAAKRTYARSVAVTKEVINSIRDRKSTRLNSSHSQISYAVFCLKKKKEGLALSTQCTFPYPDDSQT